MTIFYGSENTGVASTPAQRAGASALYGGKVRVFGNVLTLATQTTSDNWLIAKVPAGHRFLFGLITTTVTLGSAVVAVGTNSVHASNGQYRAAAVFTTVDTPTLFGVTATGVAAAATTADTELWLTIATASLPASGSLAVELFFAQAG